MTALRSAAMPLRAKAGDVTSRSLNYAANGKYRYTFRFCVLYVTVRAAYCAIETVVG